MENCLSLASMLRCLIHILVNADPMSLVPPVRKKKDFCKKSGLICIFIKAKKLQNKNLWQETQELAVARLSTLKYCDFLIVVRFCNEENAEGKKGQMGGMNSYTLMNSDVILFTEVCVIVCLDWRRNKYFGEFPAVKFRTSLTWKNKSLRTEVRPFKLKANV